MAADERVEDVERGDLVGEGLLQRPAVRRIRRAGKRVATCQEECPRGRIPDRGGLQWCERRGVAVAVEKQRAVPVAWQLDDVLRTVGEGSGIRGRRGGGGDWNRTDRNRGGDQRDKEPSPQPNHQRDPLPVRPAGFPTNSRPCSP